MNALATLRQEAQRFEAVAAFTSNDVRDIHDKVALSLNCPHNKLEVTSGSLDAVFRRVAIGNLPVLRLTYGAEIAIQTTAIDKFILLTFVLSGEMETSFNNKKVIARAGDAVIMESLEERRLAWSSDCDQLVIPLRRTAFVEAMEAVTGNVAPRHFGLEHRFALEGINGDSLTSLLKYILLQATSEARDLGTLEEPVTGLFAHHLLLNHSGTIRQYRSPRAASVPYYVRQAESYIAANVTDEISLEMIAEYARVSARTLNDGFRQYRATSPIAMLRDIRLQRAREQLLNPGSLSVTEVALNLGFNHAGRFAVAYRRRYGESPSKTIAKAREHSL